MSDEQPPPVLEPLEVREVNFYEDTITAALVKVGTEKRVYIPLRPICEYLGLSWSSQLQRTRNDEILAEALISVLLTNTETGRGKGRREVLCILLEQLPGWLFGIYVDTCISTNVVLRGRKYTEAAM